MDRFDLTTCDGATVTSMRQYIRFQVTNIGDRDAYLHIRSEDETGLLPERAASISFFAESQPDEASSLVSDVSIQSDDDGEEWQAYESTLDGIEANFE